VQTEVKKCRGCFVFNDQLGICDIPNNVPECSANLEALNCTGEGSFLVPGSTNMYYVCKMNASGFIHRETKECGKNQIYNQTTGNCDFIQNINKYFHDSSMLQCTKSGFFAHPHDCNKFIHCIGMENSTYISEIKSCSSGLYFNEVGGYCDHPENFVTLADIYVNDVS